jgi:hypothetical protein
MVMPRVTEIIRPSEEQSAELAGPATPRGEPESRLELSTSARGSVAGGGSASQ